MKILAIHKNLAVGGGERLLVNLATESLKHKQILDIVLLENKIDLNISKNITITPLSKLPSISPLFRLLFFPFFLFRLIYISKNYDLLMSFERYPSYLCFLTSKILKKKYIVYLQSPIRESFHLIFGYGIKYKVHLIIQQFVLNAAHLIFSVSKDIKRELTSEFRLSSGKIFLLYPSIDSEELDRLVKEPLNSKEKKIFKKYKVITFIGRLHSQKNLTLLIETFKSVVDHRNNVKLLLIGEGEERDTLSQLISSSKLESRIIILGNKKNPYKYLRLSDLLILTSKFEGLPNVILEALYCNIPIISSNSSSEIQKLLGPELFLDKKIKNLHIGTYGVLVNQNNKDFVNHLRKAILMGLNMKVVHKSRSKSLKFNSEIIYRRFLHIILKFLK